MERQINDSISENLTDSDLESRIKIYFTRSKSESLQYFDFKLYRGNLLYCTIMKMLVKSKLILICIE